MGKFVLRVIINALALWIASMLLPGLSVTATASSEFLNGSPVAAKVLAFLVIGLIFGVVNALIKPIIKLLSLPVTILSLGLFTIIINAAMLWLTSWLSSFAPARLVIDRFFWTAVLAAILISVISLLAGAVTGAFRSRK